MTLTLMWAAIIAVAALGIFWLRKAIKDARRAEEVGRLRNAAKQREKADEVRKRMDAVKPVSERDALKQLRDGDG